MSEIFVLERGDLDRFQEEVNDMLKGIIWKPLWETFKHNISFTKVGRIDCYTIILEKINYARAVNTEVEAKQEAEEKQRKYEN